MRNLADTADRINDRLPSGLKVGTSLVTAYPHSQRVEFMGTLANATGTKTWTGIGRALFRPLMVLSFALVAFAGLTAVAGSSDPTAANDPSNLLLIPGVNDLIPWAAAGYAIGALFISALAHELAHGVAARLEDIPVIEIGVGLVLAVPVAAYVLLDEDALEDAPPASKRRILSAGVLANLTLAGLAAMVALAPSVDLASAYSTYLGLLDGGAAATATEVHALGPVTNAVFWLVFLNANLAILNALPVMALDGGRYLRADLESLSTRSYSPTVGTWTATTVTVVVFALAVIAPLTEVTL